MIAHFRYLSYVLRHKWYVFLAGLWLGVPIWRLILHDWTKFLPCEWFPYARFFYGVYPEYVYGEARQNGIWNHADVKESFDIAWNHHQKHQDHHWQYWLLNMDDGGEVILPMPDVCRREMLADWRGAGRALGKPDTQSWYLANQDKMRLHPDTRAWIKGQLSIRPKNSAQVDNVDPVDDAENAARFRRGIFM